MNYTEFTENGDAATAEIIKKWARRTVDRVSVTEAIKGNRNRLHDSCPL